MVNMLQNINNIYLKDDPNPIERRVEMSEEILKDSTFMPETVELKDIDESFTNWVENDLGITFEDREVPTFALFSSQRFSEFQQSWENVDDNYNILMNFKIVTRENNPKIGSIYGKIGNVPKKEKYLMKRVPSISKNGNKSFIEYRMSQPMAIDITYKVTVYTNKYELLNNFNTLVNSKFKSIQCYISPNGHNMSMKLNNISDESEYNVDDRTYFSQSFEILVMGYIITEDDFEIVEVPIMRMLYGDENNRKRKPIVDIEDISDKEMRIIAEFSVNEGIVTSFTMDCDMKNCKFNTENCKIVSLRINDKKINFEQENLMFKKDDFIEIKIRKINPNKKCKVFIDGLDKN